jgi:2-oxo-hept-3-ene-1,7-dioate hydratase
LLAELDRQRISDSLLQAERERKQIPGPSRTWPDMTIEDSYAIQDLGIKSRLADGATIRGRKVGLTSKAMQRSSQIDEPDFGTLLADMFIADGGEVERDRYCVPRVELELAFIMGKRLEGPGVGKSEAIRATEYVFPSIEIIDARVEDPRTIFDTVADNAAAAGIVMGSRPIDPAAVDLRWIGGMMYRNQDVEETGLAGGVLGDPVEAVVWLANKLAQFEGRLEEGHVILTGAFVRPVWAERGDLLTADFGPMGTVSVKFT